MTTLYVVQAEEGSGIPGEPVLFVDSAKADEEYRATWREIRENEARYDDEGKPRTEDALKAVVDEIMAGDYDEDWPEDGGVRMWAVEVTE